MFIWNSHLTKCPILCWLNLATLYLNQVPQFGQKYFIGVTMCFTVYHTRKHTMSANGRLTSFIAKYSHQPINPMVLSTDDSYLPQSFHWGCKMVFFWIYHSFWNFPINKNFLSTTRAIWLSKVEFTQEGRDEYSFFSVCNFQS